MRRPVDQFHTAVDTGWKLGQEAACRGQGLGSKGAKLGWHPDDLYARVGFIVTNLSRSAERVTWFYNRRGKAEQHIKEGKNAINWTMLSCRKFRDYAVRLQLHALAYSLANFKRTLALPKAVEQRPEARSTDR